MSQIGYIYFASNASMPGLLKIGHSLGSPFERVAELRSTGVPSSFVVLACFRVKDCARAEKRIHEILDHTRLESDREFFRVSIENALTECSPHLGAFLVNLVETDGQSKSIRYPEEEEKMLLFIVHQTKVRRIPAIREIKEKFNLSDVKLELVLGNLVKLKAVNRVTVERERSDPTTPHPSYKVKAVRAEYRGIRYLLDNQLIRDADL